MAVTTATADSNQLLNIAKCVLNTSQAVREKKAKTSKKNEVSANIYHLTVAFYALVKEQTLTTSCEEEDNRQKLMPSPRRCLLHLIKLAMLQMTMEIKKCELKGSKKNVEMSKIIKKN